MTYVGKILVIVIMACSLLFLGISTVVFSTATDWRAATSKAQTELSALQKKQSDALASLEASKTEFTRAKTQHDASAKALKDQIAALEADRDRALGEMTEARKNLEVASQTAKTSLDQALALRNETNLLREQKSAVEKQANDFKIRQTELNDRIRELTRMLETATNNARDLREQVARLASVVRANGLSDDTSQMKSLESPPPVRGVVEQVDAQNRKFVISVGSDDGLVVGHVVNLYREQPRPEYLGKATVISTDPDKAVIRVIGTTVSGKRVKEGDLVSTTFRAG